MALKMIEIKIENGINYTQDINLILELPKNEYIFSSNEGTFFYHLILQINIKKNYQMKHLQLEKYYLIDMCYCSTMLMANAL